MNRLLLYIFLLFISTTSFAQKEDVPSLIIIEHDFDWYKKQYDL
jgi:hypothetical protein